VCRFLLKTDANSREMFSLASFGDLTMGAISAPPAETVAGGYTMIPQKFYHPNAGRNAIGLVGGNEVSIITGNMVDLESDLRNITRDLTRLPTRQYQPACALGGGTATGLAPIASNGDCAAWPDRLVFRERATGKVVSVSTTPRHLPTVQMMSYPGVPAPTPFVQMAYGAPWRF
jgi:hypothetical protein